MIGPNSGFLFPVEEQWYGDPYWADPDEDDEGVRLPLRQVRLHREHDPEEPVTGD